MINIIKKILSYILTLLKEPSFFYYYGTEAYGLYIATFLFNFLLEFEGNTFSSLMANIFSKENIFKSASLINLIDSLSMIIAPVSASIIALHFRFNVNLILDINWTFQCSIKLYDNWHFSQYMDIFYWCIFGGYDLHFLSAGIQN